MTGKGSCRTIVLVLATAICVVNSYKILGVLPTGSRSHFNVGDSLMRNLAKRGHKVTVISPYATKEPISNYRSIHIPRVADVMKVMTDRIPSLPSWYNILSRMASLGFDITKKTLSEPIIQNLRISNETFDVVVCEVFGTEALFGLAEHFNAPLIGLSPVGVIQWSTDLVGAPTPASYVPTTPLPRTHKMTFIQRMANQFMATYEFVLFNYYHLPRQNALFKKYFPNSRLGLDNIRRNTALVLVNSHVSLGFPRPYMPNMIDVGGMHLNRQRKPLPADMQKFLDEAKDGAIFVSMGSILKFKLLPLDKLAAVVDTFTSLKQRVMWKYEDPNLASKSGNVFISDWFPQDDILAHPNVKLFINHGGLLSVIESIYHQKPFIGIPMFGDHFQNMARAEDAGCGIMLDYNSLSKETISAAINSMLKNPSYMKMVKVISERYRDQPQDPLDLATYWVEYVARHNGAPHLHSAGQDLNFIQYHNLDAMLVLYGGSVGILSLLVWLFLKLVCHFLRLSFKQMKKKKT